MLKFALFCVLSYYFLKKTFMFHIIMTKKQVGLTQMFNNIVLNLLNRVILLHTNTDIRRKQI